MTAVDYASADLYDEDGNMPRRSWSPADLSDVLGGTWEPPTPTVGRRSDDVGLFYPSKCHTVSSESEAGKTWFALAAAKAELDGGNAVLYIDFEDDRGPVVGRLLAIGAQRESIRERFSYVRPDGPLSALGNTEDLAAVLRHRRPSLVILDGITEAMTMHGLNPLDNADCAKFGRMLPRRLADSGAAVVSLDHVTKSSEGRGRYSIGAVHKLNALDGAAFVLENRKAFGVGLIGRSTVYIAKDRPGQLRKHALPGSGLHWFADLVIDSTDPDPAVIVVDIAAPITREGSEMVPTVLMERVSTELAKHPEGLSQRVLCDVVRGKTEGIRSAVSHLVAAGYVTAKTPHLNLKPYPDHQGVSK